nr:hypothetical protein [Nocardia niwae]
MWFALVYGGVGVFAFGAFLWRVVLALRNPGNPARWAVAFAVLAADVGFEAAVPRTYTSIYDLVGVPNAASLVVYGAIAGAVPAQVVWAEVMVAAEEPCTGTAWRMLALPGRHDRGRAHRRRAAGPPARPAAAR